VRYTIAVLDLLVGCERGLQFVQSLGIFTKTDIDGSHVRSHQRCIGTIADLFEDLDRRPIMLECLLIVATTGVHIPDSHSHPCHTMMMITQRPV
jgi:hypothetical protein